MQGSSFWRGASVARGFVFFAAAFGVAVLFLVRLEPDFVVAYRLPLIVAAALLLVLSSFWYVLAPGVSVWEAQRARAAYGTHRDVLANIIAGVAIGNFLFLPILVGGVAVAEVVEAGQNPLIAPGRLLAAISDMANTNLPLLVFLSLIGLDAALLVVVYLRLVRTGATTERELGWTASHFLRNVVIGVLGFLVIIVASAVIAYVLMNFGVIQTQTEQMGIRRSSQVVFYLLLLGAGVVAPIAEETFFRGYVFRAYLTSLGPLWAYGLSAVIFAVLHLNLPALLPVILIGLILAFMFQRTGSLVSPVVAHGLNNALGIAAVYFSQQGG
jgi:uncharacterized protein